MHKVLPKLLSALFAFAFFLISTPSAWAAAYYGAYVDGYPWDQNALTTFETDAGKNVAIAHFYVGWAMTDGSQNFNFNGWMDSARNHGSIPMVTWEPWDYRNGVNQPDYQLSDIYRGTYDAYITKWAQDSKAWGYPYFLRFAHEMNGNWYPWSEQVNGNKRGDYVKVWRHVHDIFTSVGVTNVTWVWSPNVIYTGSSPLSRLYPGGNYVDWVAMDGYNWGTNYGHLWQSFSQIFSQTYNSLLALAPDKPIMIAETGSAEDGGNKADWIVDAFNQLPNNFPKIQAVVWFNKNNNPPDWRIESSTASQSAFANAISSNYYLGNLFNSLTQSPIPAP